LLRLPVTKAQQAAPLLCYFVRKSNVLFNTMNNLTIVAFGDSITQAGEVSLEKRWPSLLESVLATHEAKVVNAGVGGNTSREGLARIDEVLAHQPALVLVEFGGNDATDEVERNVPLDEFLRNLETMREKFQVSGAAMLLLTFPPIVNAWSQHTEPVREFHFLRYGGMDEHVEFYRQATHYFAARNELKMADIDVALRRAAKTEGWEKFFQPDGVHLTQDGNRVVFETVLQEVMLWLGAA